MIINVFLLPSTKIGEKRLQDRNGRLCPQYVVDALSGLGISHVDIDDVSGHSWNSFFQQEKRKAERLIRGSAKIANIIRKKGKRGGVVCTNLVCC